MDTTIAPPVRHRREEAAIAVFGTWMITGLFLDGWAHNVDKPETFFTPWHGVLYSGFVAAVLWFAWDGRRTARASNNAHASAPTPAQVGPADRIVVIGLALFVVAAVGDGIWHQVFGIEVDLEALVSPSHLGLFIGGFLMVTSPIRLAAADRTDLEPPWSRWLPQAVTLTLATALVLFFTQYLSAFESLASTSPDPRFRENEEVYGMSAVLVTNLILVMPMVFALWRWRPPFGTFALLFGGPALLMTGLDGFRLVVLVVPALIAGLVGDALVARRQRVVAVAAATSFVLWCGYFAVSEVRYGITWSVELWSGAIVLATACAALVAAMTRPRPPSPVEL